MFANRIKLFTLLGFEVYVDPSWLVLAILITWSLAVGFFPMQIEGLAASTYWWMAVAGALGLFVSIIFHELGHSVIARRYGIPMKSITLFIFGGVAEMTREPPNAKSEFMMAIAGPIASIIAAGVFYAVYWIALAAAWPVAVAGVFGYLALINLILVVFNMVPAFPLDGGRVLRSILWGVQKDLRRATRISAAFGTAFGILLMILGLVSLLAGNLIGGIWWFILGLFIRGASKMAVRQMLFRQLLEGEPVGNFMRRDPITVPSSTTIRELVDDYIYRHHHKMFPVVDDGHLTGCITLSRVKEVPQEEWGRRMVGELVWPCNEDNTITPATDAMVAFTTMHGKDLSRVMVVENGRLAGILALKDLMKFLALKLDVEGEPTGPPARRSARPLAGEPHTQPS
jgi:Zn-dependent protease/predicted transcriptional regulator